MFKITYTISSNVWMYKMTHVQSFLPITQKGNVWDSKSFAQGSKLWLGQESNPRFDLWSSALPTGQQISMFSMKNRRFIFSINTLWCSTGWVRYIIHVHVSKANHCTTTGDEDSERSTCLVFHTLLFHMQLTWQVSSHLEQLWWRFQHSLGTEHTICHHLQSASPLYQAYEQKLCSP